MKNRIRLCALFCTLTLLFGAVACTMPSETPGEDSLSESVTDAGTSADTADRESSAGTEGETPTESTSNTESTSDTESAAESDAAPEEDIALPDGYVYLYEGEDLKGLTMSSLSGKLESDEDGTEYITYRPTDADPHVYFANATQDIRLSGVRYLRIKYRTGKVTSAKLLIGNEKETSDGWADLTLTADEEWHVLEVDLMNVDAYACTLSILRLDPMEGRKSGSLEVSWMAFYPDDGAPDPRTDPLAAMPALPEDAPNLSAYTQIAGSHIYYKADGGSNGVYSFKEGFRMDVYSHEYFNRFTIGYDSTSPLRGEITYLLMGKDAKSTTHTETFFLEAGTNMTFSSLIDGYFDRAYAYCIRSVELETADGSTATFSLRSLATNVAPVISTGTYYMENDRYILGILLKWGGTISYIEDKRDNDPEIGNLINRYDPGRLVQQSYYGVKDGPDYTGGYYNGQLWSYNPVQGGNLSGTPSKLVDFHISKDGKTVSIKCRPQDWAKDELTPSYMENTYTLMEGGIRVYNRFVDFFGVEHAKHHAELPAFYTISHLGVFHYYNGTKPWTGDAYITLPNEPDWAGNKSCYHEIAEGNTETWAAWTNTAGYGIGLYVPGTEILYAGRHQYNGSKDPYNNATNYVAPLRTLTMWSYTPFIEYEYVISTGTVAEMRETFRKYAQ